MRVVVVVVLAATLVIFGSAVVVLVEAAPPFPCTYTSSRSSHTYDLSNMWRDASKRQADFKGLSNSDTFYVNVCGQTIKKCTNDKMKMMTPNGVCQATALTGDYGDGDASKATWTDYPGGAQGVSITYPSGSGGTCPGNNMRKSILNIKCDMFLFSPDGVIDSIAESASPPCIYTISMRSRWACPLSLPAQRQALVDLYTATNGPHWLSQRNWLNGDPCINMWEKVYCDSNTITRLDLFSNQLIGTIPSSIGSLVNLMELDLSRNYLSGTIPSSIGSLVNLRKLYLYTIYSTQLSGTIPSSIGSLVNLQLLDLSANQLSGTIPSSIGSLVNLQLLLLYSNQLSGTIPSSIGSLVNLQKLDLSINQLSGTIPSSIGSLVNLQLLDLLQNQLIGTIPSSIGSLVKLQELQLYSNQLNGTIPSSIGSFAILWLLSLQNNQLNSPLPPFLQTKPKFNVDLRNNAFACPLPSWCGSPSFGGNGLCTPCKSIVCCTYSNGQVSFNLCEENGVCPVVSGYSVIKSDPTPNCSVCTSSNNKSQVLAAQTHSQYKMRVQ